LSFRTSLVLPWNCVEKFFKTSNTLSGSKSGRGAGIGKNLDVEDARGHRRI
jgi:hypothetical protein